VELLGDRAVAQERMRACFKTKRPLGSGDLRSLAQAFERFSCELGLAAAGGRLHYLRQRPDRDVQLILRARPLRVLERRRVLAQAVIENSAGVLDTGERETLAARDRVSLDLVHQC